MNTSEPPFLGIMRVPGGDNTRSMLARIHKDALCVLEETGVGKNHRL